MRTESADRRNVLIVDDDQKVRDLLIELLQQEGYEVAARRMAGTHWTRCVRSHLTL